MSVTHTITEKVQTPGRLIEKSNTFSGGSAPNIHGESVPDSSTDLEIVVAIDVSAVKSFYLVSDQDVTIETNNATTPDNTISLKANKAYVYHEDSYDPFLLTVDVTSIFVTNSSGSAAIIDLEAVVDPTP